MRYVQGWIRTEIWNMQKLHGGKLANCDSYIPKCSTGRCMRGYYYNNDTNECMKCSSNCVDCTSGTKCTACHSNYCLANDACESCTVANCIFGTGTTCVLCASGYGLVGNQCKRCDVKNCGMCNKDNTKCIVCMPYYMLQINKTTCSACIDNCWVCTDTKTCEFCANDYMRLVQTAGDDGTQCIKGCDGQVVPYSDVLYCTGKPIPPMSFTPEILMLIGGLAFGAILAFFFWYFGKTY